MAEAPLIKRSDDQYSEEEAAARRDATIKTQAEMKIGKSEKNKIKRSRT
jgi:hypothetical protein